MSEFYHHMVLEMVWSITRVAIRLILRHSALFLGVFIQALPSTIVLACLTPVYALLYPVRQVLCHDPKVLYRLTCMYMLESY